jgi:PAS domain S-box-containing protein
MCDRDRYDASCPQSPPTILPVWRVIDMTDRKHAEEKLRESEECFRDYAEMASDWLWETGPDHRVMSISEHVDTIGIAPSRVPGVVRWDIASNVESEPEK